MHRYKRFSYIASVHRYKRFSCITSVHDNTVHLCEMVSVLMDTGVTALYDMSERAIETGGWRRGGGGIYLR